MEEKSYTDGQWMEICMVIGIFICLSIGIILDNLAIGIITGVALGVRDWFIP